MRNHDLLVEIDVFTAKHRMAESKFGRLVANDWKLISQLRAGRRIFSETEQKIRTFMAEYQPSEQAQPTEERAA